MMSILVWVTPSSVAAPVKHKTKTVKVAKTVKSAKATKSTKSIKKTKSNHHRTIKKVKVTKKIKVTKKKKSSKKIIAKKIKQPPQQQLVRAAPPPIESQEKINTENISQSHLPSYSLTSIEKNLIGFVRKTIETIRYTAYKLGGTRIDTSQGVYVVDCSTYVDHILKSVYPRAYTSLTSWSGTEKPTTNDYYQYFTNLSEDSRHWNMVDDVEQLRPGDIIVFRSKNRRGNETGGHVMVVMDKPTHEGNTFLVRIADSASSGHTKDTRKPRASGIGIGTMLLKVNPQTSLPYAYAWKVGSRWENNVNFAMARPVGLSPGLPN